MINEEQCKSGADLGQAIAFNSLGFRAGHARELRARGNAHGSTRERPGAVRGRAGTKAARGKRAGISVVPRGTCGTCGTCGTRGHCPCARETRGTRAGTHAGRLERGSARDTRGDTREHAGREDPLKIRRAGTFSFGAGIVEPRGNCGRAGNARETDGIRTGNGRETRGNKTHFDFEGGGSVSRKPPRVAAPHRISVIGPCAPPTHGSGESMSSRTMQAITAIALASPSLASPRLGLGLRVGVPQRDGPQRRSRWRSSE
jgi:hypothetical protein